MADIKDKVVLITGASSGIGEGIAIHFAKLGARLTLTGRNEDRLSAVVTQCKSKGLNDSQIVQVNGDITSKAIRHSIIEQTIIKFGRLDVLVNNAGLLKFGSPSSLTEDDFDQVMNVNVKAIFFLTQLAIPHLKKTKGSIINISSITGYSPVVPASVYSVSKAALDMYTKCLALELASSGVRANSINPGPIYSRLARRDDSPLIDDTAFEEEMTRQKHKVPFGRVGSAEDVAKATAFLASNELSSFITGDIMYVDGAARFQYSS